MPRLRLIFAALLVSVAALAPSPAEARRATNVDELSFTFVDTSRPAGPVSDARTLPTLVLVPEGKKDYPLVVFAHGFTANGPIYTNLMRQVAAEGYVVALPTFPLSSFGAPGGPQLGDYVNQPADVSFVITELLELDANAGSPLSGRIEEDQIGVAGHSLGAITTLGFANSCCTDARVDAIASISGLRLPFPGGTYFPPGTPPLLLVHGDADATVPYSGSTSTYAAAPPPKFLVTLLGAGHVPFRLGTDPQQPPPPWEDVTVDALVAFFDRYLENGPRGLGHLRDAADEPGVATVEASPR